MAGSSCCRIVSASDLGNISHEFSEADRPQDLSYTPSNDYQVEWIIWSG
jgi:hypothetical protein